MRVWKIDDVEQRRLDDLSLGQVAWTWLRGWLGKHHSAPLRDGPHLAAKTEVAQPRLNT